MVRTTFGVRGLSICFWFFLLQDLNVESTCATHEFYSAFFWAGETSPAQRILINHKSILFLRARSCNYFSLMLFHEKRDKKQHHLAATSHLSIGFFIYSHRIDKIRNEHNIHKYFWITLTQGQTRTFILTSGSFKP